MPRRAPLLNSTELASRVLVLVSGPLTSLIAQLVKNLSAMQETLV